MLENKILLASKSPRRREPLKLICADFEVDSADADEALPHNVSPSDAVLYLSKIKAQPFCGSEKTVIGADTVVAVDNEILGKPENAEHAFEMLSLLSGRQHSVFTGVTLLHGGKSKSFFCETKVNFYELSKQEINDYIACGECFDKAGAYGIQGKGSLFVSGICGDYFNVVGLPVSRLARELKCL